MIHSIDYQEIEGKKKKVLCPVKNREEYLAIRDSQRQKNIMQKIADAPTMEEKQKVKRGLIQFAYQVVPRSGDMLLQGITTANRWVMADFDHIPPEQMPQIKERLLSLKADFGMAMIEESARQEGYHVVFRRNPDLTQDENLQMLAERVGWEYDKGASDITRLFYTPTSDRLIHLSDEIFEQDEVVWTAGNYVPINDVVEIKTEQTETKAPVEYPSTYNHQGLDIPYINIVAAYERMKGGAPKHGDRNTFIYRLSSNIRYVCDFDSDWVASVVPDYGEDRVKWRRTVENACNAKGRTAGFPLELRKALSMAADDVKGITNEGLSEIQLPAMPKRLPVLIKHIIKNTPDQCKAYVANAVFPALASYLHGVKFELVDGSLKEPNFMCICLAKTASGKSAINVPVQYIIRDIDENDTYNRAREQEWKDACGKKGANKEKPERPKDICIQHIISDLTNASLVLRLADAEQAGEKYLYCNLEELDLLKQLQTNGTKDCSKVLCLAFDCGEYGQERVGKESISKKVSMRLNFNAASTVEKGKAFFSGNMLDGAAGRINFETIYKDYTKEFRYGRYDEDYYDKIKPYIANLKLANGVIECPQAMTAAKRLSKRVQERIALFNDEVYENFGDRAVTIAHSKAMLLYIANGMTWSAEIGRFMEWSFERDMYCKSMFFGQEIQTANERENEALTKKRRGRANLLDSLDYTFSLDDVTTLAEREKTSRKAKELLAVWKSRGYVTEDEETAGIYVKTDEYMKRCA